MCLIAILNFGCASNQATVKKELNVMENFNEENKVVFSPNIDFRIYDNISMQRQFYIDMVSTEEIKKDKLSVKIGRGVDYKYSIEQVKNEELDINTYLEYIGKKEEIEKLKKEDDSSFEYELSKYEEKLKNIDIKKINHYKIYITINRIYGNSKIEEIEIQYANDIYRVDIGTVELNSSIDLSSEEKGISMITVAASEVRVQKNEEGIENYLDSQVFKTNGNITIENIYLFKSRNKISKCSFVMENSNYSVEQEWTGEKISIPKNCTVGINLNINNQKLKSNYVYQGNEYIVIEYKFKNKNYRAYWEVNFDSALTGYELCVYLRKCVQNEEKNSFRNYWNNYLFVTGNNNYINI